MTGETDDGDRCGWRFSRRELLSATGVVAGLAGCLRIGGDGDDEPPRPERETATASGTPGTTGMPTTSERSGTTETASPTSRTTPSRTARESTATASDCRVRESVPWTLRVAFDPTIDSITPLELSFCVGAVEWGQTDGSPIVLLPPADEDDECYALAPDAVSPPVWEYWGIPHCTYDTLGLNIAASGEALQYDDGHADHDTHFGSVDGGLVQWDLGPPGEPTRVTRDDELDIVVRLDVSRSDGPSEFELEAGGVEGL